MTLVGKSWLLHVTECCATPDENLAMIDDSVSSLQGPRREVIYDAEHFYDGYKADRSTPSTLRVAVDAGARRSCCAIPMAAASPGDRGPRGRGCASWPTLGFHAHDDGGYAVGNALGAVRAGATRSRAPSTATASAAATRLCVVIRRTSAHKMGVDGPSRRDDRLTWSCRCYVTRSPTSRRTRTRPYVGASAFAHKGGVHGAATARVEHGVPARRPGDCRRHVATGRERAWRPCQRGLARAAAGPARFRRPRSGRAVEARQAARVGGRQLRGRRRVLELLVRRGRADYVAPLPDHRLHRDRRAAQRRGGARRGDRQARGRRRGAPHGCRRQRPRQRTRPGAAQGARRVLPRPRRGASCRLQGPDPRRNAATAARTG